mmetsp:Transcript_23063/g.50327  ORF Transcript_23063/g.50327 Transcript_23063/m.50327 type:complete len:153 (+) Transcript_23063:959-1417(+)
MLIETKKRQKMKYREVYADTVDSLLVLIEEKARLSLLERCRKYAMKRDLRRPWDGLHGDDYMMWRLAIKRAEADRGDDSDHEEENDDDDDDSDLYEEGYLRISKKKKPKNDEEEGKEATKPDQTAENEEQEVDDEADAYESDFDRIDEIPIS